MRGSQVGKGGGGLKYQKIAKNLEIYVFFQVTPGVSGVPESPPCRAYVFPSIPSMTTGV